MKQRRNVRTIRNGERERILIRCREALGKPSGASVAFSGFRGAALNQSRSASGVYTGLICWHECGIQESASCGRRKRRHRRVRRICDTGYIPLPRSLTRCARSFGCGERYRLTGGVENS
ncbi:TPA: hypothetical protein MIU95_28345 [Klebsiella pneumoniae]|nr:hypothetical protein [Salmonella enterica subsp. enterica serovar Typhimurium var. 5-]EEV5559169.1 hypothetical protein [Escherichia coli]HBY4777680.1 hypothetical protein [Klebsiella pneumoniae]HBY5720986.1 hypothetical protein [Klebsiella pneumoniae]